MPEPSTEVEQRVRAAVMERLPHLGSPELKPIQFAEAYAKLASLAIARAEMLGELLARAYDDEQIGALVGVRYELDRDGNPVPVGEELRLLAELEGKERDRAAQLVKDGIRLGLEAKQVDAMRSYGKTVAAALQSLCAELGVSWADEATRRAAQRAVISARAKLGFDVRSANEAGPELTDAERQRIAVGGGR